jgi:PAS domain S-box-containing protein
MAETTPEAEGRYRSLVESAGDCIYTLSTDGLITSLNPAFTRVTGWPVADWLNRPFALLIHPDDLPGVMDVFHRLLRGETPPVTEARVISQPGAWMTGEFATAPIVRDGRVVEVWGISRDITERKRNEEALRQAEERLRVALESARLVAWDWDLATNRIVCSDTAADLFGIQAGSAEEFLRLIHPEDQAAVRETITRTIAAGGSYDVEFRVPLRSGEVRWIAEKGKTHCDTHGRPQRVVGVCADISGRKRSDEVLRQSQRQLQLACEAARLGWWDWDLQTGALAWSGYHEAIFGLPPGSFNGTYGTFLSCVHPEDRDRLARAVARAIREHTPYEEEYRVVWPDASTHWATGKGHCYYDDEGRPVRMSGVVAEITARKQADEERRQLLAREQLARAEAERLLKEVCEADRRKDEFLAMLAHELRNPLAPIRNAVHLLREAGGAGPVANQARAVMERQVRHLARLVDDLLDVSRIARGKIRLRRERLDLVEVLRAAAEDHRAPLAEAGLDFRVDFPPGPASVRGDSTRLAQVLDNLLVNAAKFTDAGGRVAVCMTLDPDRRLATVTVRDTGIGIDPELLPHLFEAFIQADRSLDRSRGGLGLGLALVRGLVQLHGGEVSAASEGLGHGATFTFWVPLLREAATHVPEKAPARSPARRGRRVLIIEDNHDTAETLRTLLELAGHEVAVAYAGPAGVETARQVQPEVVLSDLGLPGMDGFAVARALRHDPATAGARLIAVTGYGQEEDQRRARDAGFDQHLVKPVDPAELLRVVEMVAQPV